VADPATAEGVMCETLVASHLAAEPGNVPKAENHFKEWPTSCDELQHLDDAKEDG
jgi:hypothetical protein